MGAVVRSFGVPPGKPPTDDTLLIIGAAGGVGSILVQLASRLTGLTSSARPRAKRPPTGPYRSVRTT